MTLTIIVNMWSSLILFSLTLIQSFRVFNLWTGTGGIKFDQLCIEWVGVVLELASTFASHFTCANCQYVVAAQQDWRIFGVHWWKYTLISKCGIFLAQLNNYINSFILLGEDGTTKFENQNTYIDKSGVHLEIF